MDISPVASTITSMARDTLTEQLLDGRDEGPAPRQRESGERDISSLQATGERRSVISLRQRNLLQLYAGSPECIGLLSLQNAIGVNMSVCPNDGSVAVFLRPVALKI